MTNKELYTFAELQEKYGWHMSSQRKDDRITYAKNRGVILEVDTSYRPMRFKVIDDSEYIPENEWHIYPKDPRFEITQKGQVRNAKNKNFIKGSLNKGYIRVNTPEGHGRYSVHRMVLETFDPRDDSDELYVDHIDGKRDNNALINLRWVTPGENITFRNINRQDINEKIQLLIEQYGYEEASRLLDTLLH